MHFKAEQVPLLLKTPRLPLIPTNHLLFKYTHTEGGTTANKKRMHFKTFDSNNANVFICPFNYKQHING